MKVLKALGLQMRAEVEPGIAGCGLTSRNGSPAMARTNAATGLALDFDTRGFDGRGTPDQARAKTLTGRRQGTPPRKGHKS